MSNFLHKLTHHGQAPQQHQDVSYGSPPPIDYGSRPGGGVAHGGGGRGKRVVGYYTNWSIYDRTYTPFIPSSNSTPNIPINDLTHINYAFAKLDPRSGTVVLSDPWADVEIHYDGDSWDEQGTNLYGNFKALYKMKRMNRNLKVLLSIGGWSYRESFKCLTDPAKRAEFARSGVRLVEDLGLDGLDIDWEYPSDRAEATAYVDLLRLVRNGLDDLSEGKGGGRGRYELTVAAPSGQSMAQTLDIRGMDQYLSFWNIMTYDFSGPWDEKANHASALYATSPGSTTNVDWAMSFYRNAGVPPERLVMGIPLYGRQFMNTRGPGDKFNGHGSGEGTVDYREIKADSVIEDSRIGAAWTYEEQQSKFVTFDSLNVVLQKAEYVKRNQYGGLMAWELSGDRRVSDNGGGGPAIMPEARKAMGQLEQRENDLHYPGSKYDNLREGRI